MQNVGRLLKFLSNSKKILCYGAGRYAQELVAYLQSVDKSPDVFVVTTPQKGEVTIFGKRIIAFDEVEGYDQYNWIVSANETNRKQIENVLLDHGIDDYFLVDENLLEEICVGVIQRNAQLKNIDIKKRCFVLGSGSSLLKQNLSLLKGEDVFICSFLGMMDIWKVVIPKGYVMPAAYNERQEGIYSAADSERFAEQMHGFVDEVTTDSIIFLDYFDRAYIQFFDFYSDKNIFYIYQEGEFDNDNLNLFDLTHPISKCNGAVGMILKIVMYLGYKEIYLLGCDFSVGKHGYTNAYNIMELQGFDYLKELYGYTINTDNTSTLRDVMRGQLNLLDEYHYLHRVAEHNNIHIYNATLGGALDEFQRMNFDDLFMKKNGV